LILFAFEHFHNNKNIRPQTGLTYSAWLKIKLVVREWCPQMKIWCWK